MMKQLIINIREKNNFNFIIPFGIFQLLSN